jgi:hypothetical protein
VRIHPVRERERPHRQALGRLVRPAVRPPPFLRLKPRPEGRRYADAAASSMQGDHEPMRRYLLAQLMQRFAP